jgi:hypothetical protein
VAVVVVVVVVVVAAVVVLVVVVVVTIVVPDTAGRLSGDVPGKHSTTPRFGKAQC